MTKKFQIPKSDCRLPSGTLEASATATSVEKHDTDELLIINTTFHV